MSQYAIYIWTAYGAAAVILIGLWLVSVRALKARQAELERAEAASPRARR
jgi:heme exporter protein D